MYNSLQAGHAVHLDRIETIADGLTAPFAGERNFDIVRRYVEDIVLLDDETILEGMRFLLARAKLLAEPAGAAATAALLAGKVTVAPGARVVAVVSGGNIDLPRLKALL
jgi:threonine dehydratase